MFRPITLLAVLASFVAACSPVADGSVPSDAGAGLDVIARVQHWNARFTVEGSTSTSSNATRAVALELRATRLIVSTRATYNGVPAHDWVDLGLTCGLPLPIGTGAVSWATLPVSLRSLARCRIIGFPETGGPTVTVVDASASAVAAPQQPGMVYRTIEVRLSIVEQPGAAPEPLVARYELLPFS